MKYERQITSSRLMNLDSNIVFFFALIFVFSIPWENAIPVPGIGTISRALGIPLIAVWLLQLVRKSSFRTPVTFHLMTGLFVFWCACSLFWTVDLNTSVNQLKTFLQLYILCFVLWTELYSEKRCLLFSQAYVLGAFVVAVFIFVNYNQGNVTRWDRRATIAGIDENDIALVLSTALPMAWMLLISTKKYAGRWMYLLKITNLAYLPACVIAMIMTGSRGGFASLIPSAIFILLTLSTRNITAKKKLLMIPLIMGGIYTVMHFAPSQPFQRIATTFESLSTGGVSGRWDIWQAGLTAWNASDFSILFGLGVGGHYASVGRIAHNTPISVLVETGAIGLMFLAAILITILFATFKGNKQRKTKYTLFAIALLTTWSIGVLALSWEYRKPTWVIWSLLICFAYALPLQTQNLPGEHDDRNH